MTGPNWYLRLDIYGVFRLPNDASNTKIKRRYMQLALKFHPDKIGRAPTDNEVKTWHDINESWVIFQDADYKKDWDKYDNILDAGRTTFQCLCEDCVNYPHYGEDGVEIGRGRFITRHTGYKSNISMRWFCSQAGAKKWEAANNYTAEVHGYAEAGGPPPPPPPPPTPERNCPGCGYKKAFKEGGKWWVNLNQGEELFCSDDCLFSYCRNHNINAKRCAHCGMVKTWKNSVLGWRRNEGEIYCGDEHSELGPSTRFGGSDSGLGSAGGGNDPLKAAKTSAIAEIEKSLKQNPEVKDLELENGNQNWRNDIQNTTDLTQITVLKNRVLADIKNKRDAKGGDPLLTHKNTAIAEIDGEMLKDPEIQLSELEATNQNYGADILAATSEDKIKQIKDRVIANIRTKRQAKSGGGGGGNNNLNNLRQQAINQIRVELSQQPVIDESQLINQNWEANINQAQNENEINKIRDQTLADIRNKRAAKAEENEIINLLQQAKAATKYEELEIILKKIKLLFSSNAYKKYQEEIKNQEEKLQRINPQKYKETVRKSIADQLTQNGLRLEDFDQKTQEEIEEAINSGDQQKIDQVEEKIAVKGAEKKLDDILILAKKATTLEEKQKVINELLRFIVDSANDYQQKAYQSRKSTVDSMLAKLRGKEQTETPSKPLSPLIITLLAISLLGLIITALLIIRRKRQQRVIKSIR